MNCCVAVPVYQELRDPLEIASFLRLRQLASTDVFLVAPEGLSLSSYRNAWPGILEKRFPARCFIDIGAYNKLMLSTAFYESFSSRYEWLLIHQLDAFLFSGNYDDFCGLSYDYFGAPWTSPQLVRPGVRHPRLLQVFGRRVKVGNGGLSLRRLSSTLKLLRKKEKSASNWLVNEDAFFSYWGSYAGDFRSCPENVATRFAFESEPEALFLKNRRQLPMGCHAFNKIHANFYAVHINPLFSEIPRLKEFLDGRTMPAPYFIANSGLETNYGAE